MPGTRVVLRQIEAGLDVTCPRDHGGCGELVRFNIQIHRAYRRQVVANVYWNGRWNRVEHWHLLCYLSAGSPYGPVPNLKDGAILLKVVEGAPIGMLFSDFVQMPLPT